MRPGRAVRIVSLVGVASTPFASAASMGPHKIFEETTVATSYPIGADNSIAARPGRISEPEIIAAIVSNVLFSPSSYLPRPVAREYRASLTATC